MYRANCDVTLHRSHDIFCHMSSALCVCVSVDSSVSTFRFGWLKQWLNAAILIIMHNSYMFPSFLFCLLVRLLVRTFFVSSFLAVNACEVYCVLYTLVRHGVLWFYPTQSQCVCGVYFMYTFQSHWKSAEEVSEPSIDGSFATLSLCLIPQPLMYTQLFLWRSKNSMFIFCVFAHY